MAMSENLRRLEELITGRVGVSVEYEGGTRGWCLCDRKDTAVQIATISSGEKLGPHSHKVKEILVVISGLFQCGPTSHLQSYKQGDVVTIEPGEEHECYAETDCVVVGLLVPRNGGYPNAC